MRRLAVLLAALALAGCAGSASFRAGPTPTGTTPAPASSGSGSTSGGSVHLSRGAAWAIVLGVAVVDGVQWTSRRLRQAFGAKPEQAKPAADAPDPPR